MLTSVHSAQDCPQVQSRTCSLQILYSVHRNHFSLLFPRNGKDRSKHDRHLIDSVSFFFQRNTSNRWNTGKEKPISSSISALVIVSDLGPHGQFLLSSQRHEGESISHFFITTPVFPCSCPFSRSPTCLARSHTSLVMLQQMQIESACST